MWFTKALLYITCVRGIIHSVFCLTTGPKPSPKWFLHIVRSRASSFKWEYPLLSLRSSSSFLPLLPRLLATSISPSIFPSITCFRRQLLSGNCFDLLLWRQRDSTFLSNFTDFRRSTAFLEDSLLSPPVRATCIWRALVEGHRRGKTEVLGERPSPMPLCPS